MKIEFIQLQNVKLNPFHKFIFVTLGFDSLMFYQRVYKILSCNDIYNFTYNEILCLVNSANTIIQTILCPKLEMMVCWKLAQNLPHIVQKE